MSGRPKAQIDWKKVGQYIRAQCSTVGIAGILGISPDTLYTRCKKDNKMDFTAFVEQKKAEGKELLRAKQYDVAMEGDKTMLVWLGKQYLGQTDKNELNATVDNSVTVEVVHTYQEQDRHFRDKVPTDEELNNEAESN